MWLEYSKCIKCLCIKCGNQLDTSCEASSRPCWVITDSNCSIISCMLGLSLRSFIRTVWTKPKILHAVSGGHLAFGQLILSILCFCGSSSSRSTSNLPTKWGGFLFHCNSVLLLRAAAESNHSCTRPPEEKSADTGCPYTTRFPGKMLSLLQKDLAVLTLWHSQLPNCSLSALEPALAILAFQW